MNSITSKSNFSKKHDKLQREQLKHFFAMKLLYDFSFSEEEYEKELSKVNEYINKAGDFYFLEIKELQGRNVILRNFGTLPLFLVTRASDFEKFALVERIEVSISDTNRKMSFMNYMSPLEVWLNYHEDRNKNKINEKYHKYHPARKTNFDRSISYSKAKKDYRSFNVTLETNFDTQLKTYIDLIKYVIGEESLKSFSESCPDKIFQLVELLSETKKFYGVSLKPLFLRLKDELSFSLVTEPSLINYTIPLDLEYMNETVLEFMSKFYSPDDLNKKNPNLIPAILKEILTYCIDAVGQANIKNLIKILPSAFERTIKNTYSSNVDGFDAFCEIGKLLRDSNDIFAQFAYRLQMLLIGIYYRSKISLLRDVAIFSEIQISENVHKEVEKDFKRLVNSQERGIGVDVKKRSSIYDSGSKFFFQVLGIFWIDKGYEYFNSIRIDDSCFNIPIRVLKLQRQIEKNKQNKFISEKYFSSKIKGISKPSNNILREIERCARLSLDLNKDISLFMDPLHLNYIKSLCFLSYDHELNHADILKIKAMKAGDRFFPSSMFKSLINT